MGCDAAWGPLKCGLFRASLGKKGLKKILGRDLDNTTCYVAILQYISAGNHVGMLQALEECYGMPVPPSVSNSLTRWCQLYKNSKNAKFPDDKELARRLGVETREIHRTKNDILKASKDDVSGTGIGDNPDIGFDEIGNIFLKDRGTGKVVPTGL